MTVHLSRRYRFSAAHRLHSPALSEEENRATYGKCNNPHGHGHDYEVELTVAGPVDEKTGRIVDLESLDGMVEAEILRPFRFTDLNLVLQSVPTTENLTEEAAIRLASTWIAHLGPDAPRFEKIRIWETERNICEVSAPKTN